MKVFRTVGSTISLLAALLVLVPSCRKTFVTSGNRPVPGSVTDADGKVYHTVIIGTQAWLASNLATTHYGNGDSIPQLALSARWKTATSGGYCNYDNLDSNAGTYGRLYNWLAVSDNRKLCPKGWHVPDETEWSVLTSYLGGEAVAGGAIKEPGYNHWQEPNTGATDLSGFAALPAGYRNDTGTFGNLSRSAIFWSSTVYDPDHAWYRYSYYNYPEFFKDFYHNKSHGFSVRCIMDKN